jgi:hypothetical protein
MTSSAAHRLAVVLLLGPLSCGKPAEDISVKERATWHVDSLPFIEIGGREDDTTASLGRPHSVAMVEDSLVMVGDYQFRELRYFNRSGELVRTAGREGEGPGEFRLVTRFRRCGDSLHVYDQQNSRHSVIGPEGKFARQYGEAAPERATVQMPYDLSCNLAGQFIKYAYSIPNSKKPATMRPIVPFWLSDQSGQVTADLGDFPGPELHVFPVGNSGQLPMGRVPVIAIGASRAYIGTSDSSIILTYRLDGTLVSAITVPFSLRSATEADREWFKYTDTLGQDPRLARSHAARWPDVAFPDVLPAYTALLVDPADLLWIREYPQANSPTVRWAAVTETGTLIGTLDLPVVLQVFENGVDYVLGIEADPISGSQHIRAYRLHR